jgi:hypothetical protein
MLAKPSYSADFHSYIPVSAGAMPWPRYVRSVDKLNEGFVKMQRELYLW